METEYVHFRLNENTGKLLIDIAREHLLLNLDPYKALAAITESLQGCSEELAKRIIKGDVVILVNEDETSFDVVKYDPDIHKKYTPLNIEEWVKTKHEAIGEEGREIFSLLDKYHNQYSKTYDITLAPHEAVQISEGNYECLPEKILDYTEISDINDVLEATKNYIDRASKYYKVFKTLENWYPRDLLVEGRLQKYTSRAIGYVDTSPHMVYSMVIEKLNQFIRGQPPEDNMRTELERYIESAKYIEKKLSQQIQPVDIFDNYDAGWLSPEGTYYGLNGSKANFLHNEIANALYHAGVITHSEENANNPDGWLNQNGWARHTGKWINYEGYYNPHLEKPIVPMSSKQVKILAQFGQRCHDGTLELGLSKTPVSAAKLEMFDTLMLRKYFKEL